MGLQVTALESVMDERDTEKVLWVRDAVAWLPATRGGNSSGERRLVEKVDEASAHRFEAPPTYDAPPAADAAHTTTTGAASEAAAENPKSGVTADAPPLELRWVSAESRGVAYRTQPKYEARMEGGGPEIGQVCRRAPV